MPEAVSRLETGKFPNLNSGVFFQGKRFLNIEPI